MIHITFASDNMTISAANCHKTAIRYGAKGGKIFGPEDIDACFFERNMVVLESTRGAGYWLWKPYIINKMLDILPENEILIYTDAGLSVEQPLELLVKEMSGYIMVFGNRWRHGDWCKMDVLKEMDCEKYAEREQLQASCIILRVSDFAKDFVSLWLDFCQKPGYIDDSPSKIPNPKGWREHRHDQAILTNLVFLWNISVHWWPAQYNLRNKHKYENKYPVIQIQKTT